MVDNETLKAEVDFQVDMILQKKKDITYLIFLIFLHKLDFEHLDNHHYHHLNPHLIAIIIFCDNNDSDHDDVQC